MDQDVCQGLTSSKSSITKLRTEKVHRFMEEHQGFSVLVLGIRDTREARIKESLSQEYLVSVIGSVQRDSSVDGTKGLKIRFYRFVHRKWLCVKCKFIRRFSAIPNVLIAPVDVKTVKRIL